jgi:hypothetical protein
MSVLRICSGPLTKREPLILLFIFSGAGYPVFNLIELEPIVMKLLMLLALAGIGLAGCYQVHSDDDLRTVPVTNNPNIVPGQGQRLPSMPM